MHKVANADRMKARKSQKCTVTLNFSAFQNATIKNLIYKNIA